MAIVSPSTKCIKEDPTPQPNSLASQILWLQQQINGASDLTIDTTGFTTDTTLITTDKVVA
jgi:hypothetical protein